MNSSLKKILCGVRELAPAFCSRALVGPKRSGGRCSAYASGIRLFFHLVREASIADFKRRQACALQSGGKLPRYTCVVAAITSLFLYQYAYAGVGEGRERPVRTLENGHAIESYGS